MDFNRISEELKTKISRFPFSPNKVEQAFKWNKESLREKSTLKKGKIWHHYFLLRELFSPLKVNKILKSFNGWDFQQEIFTLYVLPTNLARIEISGTD